MSLVRLVICVSGVYAMFLLWAIAQERLSVPFRSTVPPHTSDKFHFPLFMGTCQSILSSLSALLYLLIRRPPTSTVSLSHILGLSPPPPPPPTTKTQTNGSAKPSPPPPPKSLLRSFLQISLLSTLAAPFGFASLAHVSYPFLVLAKSCKLVPVMLMNILVYRRAFAPHKYAVVALVTAGIALFMHFGEGQRSSRTGSKGEGDGRSPYLGLLYLLVNLLLDGLTNSTQDEIFRMYRHLTGQQMMFWMNVFGTGVSTLLAVLPLPYIPVIHPSHGAHGEFGEALAFVRTHEGAGRALLGFAVTGAVGQLFIFETLQHFGSLTLVTITLTRKLFTMLLSVVVYNHTLTAGQWLGAAVVFAGICLEAYVKRRDVHAKRVVQEKEKPALKEL
ncbi:UAA transporter [Gloeophyllum trabeum ATCC 11539]|uniref:UDP-galactose transporter homolog 1 n=1 Tax=Gloeophyllum trabeum (strain ATCC 11539 / FP-39264 / Madison 617) TaxID=670483 RepID=S7RK29_GLOTA|nr:UAA transporter [Gloeophyllum trabeum ATCC 11539]EPQ54745.1 UAA transporter [Gloeophyllum trabeum ATCC 11539]